MALRETLNANFKQLKEENKVNNAYLTGELSTEKKMFEQVKDMKRSTFDRSKFTVVGTPTITDDGIVSNFSDSNYLATSTDNNYIDLNKFNSWKIGVKFKKTASTVAYQYIVDFSREAGANVGIYVVNNTNSVACIVYDNSYNLIVSGATGSYQIQNNVWYYITFEFTGNKYIGKISEDNSNWTTFVNIALSTKCCTTNTNVLIGRQRLVPSRQLQGSIDVKEFYTIGDGVEVFNGNKTGIDQIKKDDYTVVGSPVISDDGVVSGFSSANYAEISHNPIITDNYRLEFSFTTGDVVQSSSIQSIVTVRWSGTGVLGQIYLRNASNTLGIDLHNSTGSIIVNTLHILDNLQPNTKYYCAISLENGTDLYTYVNGVQTAHATFSKNSFMLFENGFPIRLGQTISSVGDRKFLGSIDLNSFKIYVNGDLICQPTLRIPYTQSKTGSKIVYATYRDRVQDMYEQFGQANYYTLSDTDVTLPMGEVYGMIEEKEDRWVYFQDGASGYKYNTRNGYCEQWGFYQSPTSGDHIATTTFLKTFKDTNYNIVCTIYALNRTSTYNSDAFISTKTTTSFSGFMTGGTSFGRYWKASGYLAEGEY